MVLDFLTASRARCCPDNLGCIPDDFKGPKTSTEGDAAFKRERYNSIVLSKMVHVLIRVGVRAAC